MERGTAVFGELFAERNVLVSLRARSREEALKEMLDALGRAELVPSREVPKLFTALLEREKLGSTGIGNGYAIPHVKHGSVKDLEVALGISRYGIDFNSIDGEPVTHVFLIVANPEAPEEYLRLLQWIAKIARNQDFTRFLRNAKDVPEILSLLREMSE